MNNKAQTIGIIVVVLIAIFLMLVILRFVPKQGNLNVPYNPNAPFEKITYVALGASETVGSSATPYPTAGFSYLIRDRLANYYKNVNYFNFAIGGKPGFYIYNTEVPKALSKNPDFVTIMTGGNDIISGVSEEEFSNNLDLILKTLNDNGIKVFIGTFPDISNFPRFKQNPDSSVTKDRVIAFNEIITNKAKKYNSIVVDVYNSRLSTDNSLIALKNPQGKADGLHPNTQGHILLADLFWNKISKELGL